jgi:Ca-activated chloride channel family protein
MFNVRSRSMRPVYLLSTVAVLFTTASSGQPVVDGVGSKDQPSVAECARLGFNWTDQGAQSNRVGTMAVAAPLPAPQPPGGAADLAPPAVLAPAMVAPNPGGGEAAFVDAERYPLATPNPVVQVATQPVSTFSIDVDTAAYSNVRRFLNDNQLPPTDAVRIEELINYFDYGYAAPASPDVPFATVVNVTPSPWAEGRQIVHIGLQGYELPATEEPPLNLVFLIDVSGSMWGDDRLPLAQEALGLLVDQLGPEDRVSIVVYAGAAGAVLPPTPGDQKLVIRCAIGALQAGGSTAGGAGMALAYDLAEQNFDPDAVNRVILLTDGDFNVGVTNTGTLEDFVEQKRETGVYLSVYGFGRGNYNDVMMQTLSQAGNGTAAYIDTLQEARRLFLNDFSSSFFPIADDVKVQIEFNPARVAEYRLIGYETRILDQADFNNDRVDAGEVNTGASVTVLYEITPVGGATAIEPLRYQPAVAPGGGDVSAELAFLSIRFKHPGEDVSELIGRAITDADSVTSVAAAPEATRWALAVAAYGQLLRGDPYMANGFAWADVIDLAQTARGEDPFGIRAEFVQLVRAASVARPLNN